MSQSLSAMRILQAFRKSLSLDLQREKGKHAELHARTAVRNGPPYGRADHGHQQPAL